METVILQQLSQKISNMKYNVSYSSIVRLILVSMVSIGISLFFFSSSTVLANSPQIEAQITEIYETPCPTNSDVNCIVADINVEDSISKGVVIKESGLNSNSYDSYKEGDIIFVRKNEAGNGYFFVSPKRTSPLLILVILFVVVSLVIGGIKGLRSLLSLFISTGVIFFVILPLLINHPSYIVLIGGLGAFAVFCINQLLGHGFNKKIGISIGVASITFALVIGLSIIFAYFLKINGLGDDNSLFISQLLPRGYRLGDLFIVGILFGLSGAIDDVITTQISTINELVTTNPTLTVRQLYTKAMRVGTDHMVSIVNTLFLAYIGAGLPTFMLFALLQGDPFVLIGRDDILEEIVRTIIASSGLVVSIPLATYCTAFFLSKNKQVNRSKSSSSSEPK